MNVVYKNPLDLIAYALNNKVHDKVQIDKIATSIREFGFLQPVVITSDNTIIVGHGRVEGAMKLGIAQVPCLIADDLTPEQVRRYRIMDNRLNESAWNLENLKLEIAEFPDLRLEFEELNLFDDEKKGKQDDDEIPETPVTPKSRHGELYKLGNHLLLCGDSTNAEEVHRLMQGERADLVWTDPPYNVDYEGGTIKNNSMEDSKFYHFLLDAFTRMYENTKTGGGIYIAHADSEGVNFRNAMKDAGFMCKQCLIWVKNALVMGRQDYQWQHEPILYGWKPGDAHYFTFERNHTTVIDDDADYKNMDKKQMQKVIEQLKNELQTSVVRDDKPLKNDIHHTMKPVSLVSRFIRNSSKPGQIVMDLFGGSGTTLIACEKLNRHARICELDPRFIDVIITRWEDWTGEKAILLNQNDGSNLLPGNAALVL